MIHSKLLNTDIPIQIQSRTEFLNGYGMFTHYQIKDNKIPVGYVDLRDTPKGCFVLFIKNQNPHLYSGLGKIADQIEVEHCLNRGINNPEIISEAGLSSHIQHYKRGKRFFDDWVNKLVSQLIKKQRNGEKFDTTFIGAVKMFMPKKIVQKYIELIKRSPLILKKFNM